MPSNKRARSESGSDQDSEKEDDQDNQWKFDLRAWLQVAPERYREAEWYDFDDFHNRHMIERLLELPKEDPASDEAFAILMEKAADLYDGESGDDIDYIHLGQQDDFPYTEVSEDSMPYLKKFLTEIPQNMKALRLEINAPEVIEAFPDQIGTEGSTLEKIVIRAQIEYYSETGPLEWLSLANILYVTRNVKDVFLSGFHALTPDNSPPWAFHSKTKKIGLSDIIVSDDSLLLPHPNSAVSFESIKVVGLRNASGLNGLEKSRLFWRQLMQASKQTLSTISIAFDRDHLLEGFCIEAANASLNNIETIKLDIMQIDLLQPLRHLLSSRVGSTLKRLEFDQVRHELLPSLAPTLARFENLEDLLFDLDRFTEVDPDPFLTEYFSLQPPALRKVELKNIDYLTPTSFEALFSIKTLESIKLGECEKLFSKCEKPFSLKNLRSLHIQAQSYPRCNYRGHHIAKVLEVLPDLRCLKIDGVVSMSQEETRSIANAIAEHTKLCIFEPKSFAIASAAGLPCLRNRFKASEKQLPSGFIPNVIVRSEELCGASGIFQFLKEQAPSYLGS